MQDIPSGKAAGEANRESASPRPTRKSAALRAGVAAAAAATIVSAIGSGFSPWHVAALAGGIGVAFLLASFGRGESALRPDTQDAAKVAGLPALPLLAALGSPAIVVDDRGVVLIANEPAQRIAPPIRPGKPLFEALRQPDILVGLERVGATGRGETVAFAEPPPGKRVFAVDIAPLPATEGDERPGAIVLWFHDRTEIRRVEELRSDFVANASHELRTPLASVLGFIETLQGPAREDAAAREKFLGIMAEQARRMARLIDDLLSLSRIEMNQHVRPTAIVAVEPLVGHICDTLRPMAAERGVTIEVSPTDHAHTVVGERDEILRVLENLVENAVKYGGSPGKVEISVGDEPAAGAKPAMATIAVRDHGPGIAPEHLPRLTERFYRVDVAESRGKGGTGLGLAIVKHIVARHAGRLVIESKRGEGATFQVSFPLAPVVAAPPAAVTEPSSS